MIMTYKNEWTRTLALTAIGLTSLACCFFLGMGVGEFIATLMN